MLRTITARQRLSACGRAAKSIRRGQGKLSTHRRWDTHMPDRDVGDDVVDQVRGGLDHAPGTAGGAKPTLLAGEGNQQLVTAAIALHPDEPMLQAAAGEIAAELIEDEPGQRPLAFVKAALEGRQVLLDQTVENAVFGAMPCVARPDRGRRRSDLSRRWRDDRGHRRTVQVTNGEARAV